MCNYGFRNVTCFCHPVLSEMYGFGNDPLPATALSLHGSPKTVIRNQPSSPRSQLLLSEGKGSRCSLDGEQCLLFLVFEKRYSKEETVDFIDYSLCFFPFLQYLCFLSHLIYSHAFNKSTCPYTNDYRRKFKSLALPFLLNCGFLLLSV